MSATFVSKGLTVIALAVMARLTRALMLVLVAAVLAGCGDEPDWIVIDGQRYVGVEIPLQVDEGSASTIGLVTEANHQGRLGLELVALWASISARSCSRDGPHPSPNLSRSSSTERSHSETETCFALCLPLRLLTPKG